MTLASSRALGFRVGVRDCRGIVNGSAMCRPVCVVLRQVRARTVVDAYKSACSLRAGCRNRRIVRHLAVIHGIFKRAKRKGWVKENPASADLVERPPDVYTGEFDTLTFDEVELLAAHAATGRMPRSSGRLRIPG